MLQSFCYDFICFFLNVRVCFIIFATNIVLFFTRIFFRMLSYHTRTHVHAKRCAVEFAARGFRCTYIHTYIRKDTHRSNRILAIESCKNINEHRYEHCTYFLGIVWQFGRGHSRNPTSFRRAFFLRASGTRNHLVPAGVTVCLCCVYFRALLLAVLYHKHTSVFPTAYVLGFALFFFS